MRPYHHVELSQADRETIVAALQSGKVTTQELADQYNVGASTLRRIYVEKTGKPLTRLRPNTNIKLAVALKQREYRAWHKHERKMYEVLGIDWFNQKVKILDSGLLLDNGKSKWHDLHIFMLMEYSGLRDSKRTQRYPEGQEICVGDIIQYPINLLGNDGKTRETIVKHVVMFGDGSFILDKYSDYDLLALYSDECEVIGTIFENPELVPHSGEILKDLFPSAA